MTQRGSPHLLDCCRQGLMAPTHSEMVKGPWYLTRNLQLADGTNSSTDWNS